MVINRGTLTRTLTGFGGGYVLAASSALLMAQALPMLRLDAVLTGGMIGFLIYVGAIIWAFAARTPIHACAGVLGPAIVIIGVSWMMR